MFGKKAPGSNSPAAQAAAGPAATAPFDRSAVAPLDRSTPPSALGGVLAGQVMDSYNHRPPAAFIQVTEIRPGPPASAAPIEVAADGQGYFYIQGLQPGRHYQLTARARDGNRFLAGTTLAIPPNSRLLITITEDLARASTPPLPPATTWPGAEPAAPNRPASVDAAGSDRPAATPPAPTTSRDAIGVPGRDLPAPAAGHGTVNLDSPAGVFGAPANPGSSGSPAPAAQPRMGHPERTAAAPEQARNNPLAVIPAQPGNWSAPRRERPSGDTAARVPSCDLEGKILFNLALYDLNGQPWEFRLNRRGKLILLDFWQTTCWPCKEAMKWHLIPWQRQFGPYGLEIVGIAYESGSPQEQAQRVARVRDDLRINYPLLLGTGGQCPVKTQFGVSRFPTLVLLDENGRVLWQTEGLGREQVEELELMLKQRLGAP
jgi:hypothetical protein